MKCTFAKSRHAATTTPVSSVSLTMVTLLPLLLPSLLLLLLPSTTTTANAYLFTRSTTNDDNNNQSDDCLLCLAMEDPESCERCNSGEESFLPNPEDVAVLPSLSEGVQKRWGYEPIRRFQRGAGCSCCMFSRLNNAGCCAACTMSQSSHAGKRSAGGDSLAMMTSGSDDAARMTSGRGSGRRRRDDCFCCSSSGDMECCKSCVTG